MSARVPHCITLSGGREVWGYRTVALCPRCHREEPHAAALLAFFAKHERIETDTVGQAAVLIRRWAEHASAKTYTDHDLIQDMRRFESGEEP